jgi:hypothetical protein
MPLAAAPTGEATQWCQPAGNVQSLCLLAAFFKPLANNRSLAPSGPSRRNMLGTLRVDLIHSGCPPAMAAVCGYYSLMGQGGCSSWVSTPWGCLCSLRARLALDGVSWVQSGLVEGAVGQELAAATQSAPSSAPSLGRRSLRELDSASCP